MDELALAYRASEELVLEPSDTESDVLSIQKQLGWNWMFVVEENEWLLSIALSLRALGPRTLAMGTTLCKSDTADRLLKRKHHQGLGS